MDDGSHSNTLKLNFCTEFFPSSCRNLALYPQTSCPRRVCGSSFPRHLEKTQKEPQKFNCRGERAGYLLTVRVVWIDFLPWYKHFCGSSSSCFPCFPLSSCSAFPFVVGRPFRQDVQRGAFSILFFNLQNVTRITFPTRQIKLRAVMRVETLV